ncbi:MAG: molecular chaperone DnaJ [Oscillatoriales cyanobacterium SM2_1_8]|nr:molecular chaperone DnaJ [Oscillatoriales cyanobacterium SM2_1_8]
MNEPTPYELLGVSDVASFEEIRDARDRLLKACEGDDTQLEAIEAAYDGILMDRLRARKEGRVAVPDRIRFPEKNGLPVAPPVPSLPQSAPNWLRDALDRPDPQSLAVSIAVFAGLGTFAILAPQGISTWLSLAFFFAVFWLNRKQKKLGRAFLLVFLSFVVGVTLALSLQTWAATPFAGGVFPNPPSTFLILTVMWLVAAFLC